MKTKVNLCLALVLCGGFVGARVGNFTFAGPPAELGSDLPGVSKGKIEAYWLAPYVWASEGFGGGTITWFNEGGQVKDTAHYNGGIQPGFVARIGGSEALRGVNEDWRITLPASTGSAGYITSTPDSRVFVRDYEPTPRQVALDMYVHGKLVSTVGPYLRYQGSGVRLSDDGSAGLLVWKDENKTTAQLIALNVDGAIRFRVDCDGPVYSPIAAPDGAGVLLRSNAGGDLQNTFMWYTAAGKVNSRDIDLNPCCVGWIPKSCKSLISTGRGDETKRYRLIDWNKGESLWDIPCPGNGEALAVGFTPKHVIFAVAELYKPGPARGDSRLLGSDGKDWVRTFYAVDIKDGSLAARWQARYPQRLGGDYRDHFLWVNDKLFFMTAAEFVELNLEDVSSKRNGWDGWD